MIHCLILLSLACALGAAAVLHRIGLINIPEPSKRIGCIDGLRGYLALGVFFGHYIIWTFYIHGGSWMSAAKSATTINSGVVSIAGEAVTIFFMVTGVLFYAKVTNLGGVSKWRHFFIGRVFVSPR